jgi:MFS family permease
MLATGKTRFRDLTILVGSTSLVLVTAGLAPALPGIASAFRDAPNAGLLVRLSLTMPALLGAISALFAGLLADRWGRKPLILSSLLLYGLSGSAGFYLDSLAGILLSRAVLGMAVAGLANGFVTLLADTYSGTRLNRYTGLIGAFAGLGGVVYQLIAGYLAGLSWRFPFLMYLVAFVILLSVLFTVEEPPSRAQTVPTERTSARPAIPLPGILSIYSLALAGMVVLFTMIVHVPFYLTTYAGASSSQVGLALSVQALPGGFIALLYARIKNRYSFQSLAGLVFLNLGISHVVASLTSSYGLVLAGLLVGGLGFGLMVPNLISWLASIAPPAVRGRAVGGLNTALFLGQFITPMITQPLVDRAGITAAFSVAGGISILLAAVLIGGRLRQSIKRDPLSARG